MQTVTGYFGLQHYFGSLTMILCQGYIHFDRNCNYIRMCAFSQQEPT